MSFFLDSLSIKVATIPKQTDVQKLCVVRARLNTLNVAGNESKAVKFPLVINTEQGFWREIWGESITGKHLKQRQPRKILEI